MCLRLLSPVGWLFRNHYYNRASRSRRHGLRKGQAHIKFQFRKEGMGVHTEIQRTDVFSVPQIALTKEVEDRLNQLAGEGITSGITKIADTPNTGCRLRYHRVPQRCVVLIIAAAGRSVNR